MSTKPDSSGDRPAFPFEHGHSPDAANVRECGISLRDYLAAKALVGVLASEAGRDSVFETVPDDAQTPLEIALPPSIYARAAYELADAMLEARARPANGG
jgi:hypothetical protein